jgi:hypothetical protein
VPPSAQAAQVESGRAACTISTAAPCTSAWQVRNRFCSTTLIGVFYDVLTIWSRSYTDDTYMLHVSLLLYCLTRSLCPLSS